MSSESSDEIVTFRLAPRDRAAIARLVESGEFRNRSDFLRYAVKATIAAHEGRVPAKLDLDIEGVELPTSPSPARGKRSARSHKGVNL